MVTVLLTTVTLKVKHGSVHAGGRPTPQKADSTHFCMRSHTVCLYSKRTGSGSYMTTAPQQRLTSMTAWSYSANPLHSQTCRGHSFVHAAVGALMPPYIKTAWEPNLQSVTKGRYKFHQSKKIFAYIKTTTRFS